MSSSPPGFVPENIQEAASMARTLARKEKRTREEEERLNQARLKIAFWACRKEGVYTSWDNLQFVLGAHAAAIRPALDRVKSGQAREDAAEARRRAARRKEESDMFWGGRSSTAEPVQSGNRPATESPASTKSQVAKPPSDKLVPSKTRSTGR